MFHSILIKSREHLSLRQQLYGHILPISLPIPKKNEHMRVTAGEVGKNLEGAFLTWMHMYCPTSKDLHAAALCGLMANRDGWQKRIKGTLSWQHDLMMMMMND